MNLYLLVEGRHTEKKVYAAWLSHALVGHTEVASPDDVLRDNYFILAGFGYPSYLQRLRMAVEDLRAFPVFDELVVCVDAEEMAPEDKEREILDVLTQEGCPRPARIFVQNACIETWFLGNRSFVRRNPQDAELRAFVDHYDVTRRDPEHLAVPPGDMAATRAQYHTRYFKAACRERRVRYSKRHPGPTVEAAFFRALVRRADDGRHLESFRHVVSALRGWGANI